VANQQPPHPGLVGDSGSLSGGAVKALGGGIAVLCIMGPAVPWEWIWFLAKGQPRAAFRRLRHNGAEWSGIAVHYPSIAETRRAFAPAGVDCFCRRPNCDANRPHFGRSRRQTAGQNPTHAS